MASDVQGQRLEAAVKQDEEQGRLGCGGSTEVEEHRLLLVIAFSMLRSAGRKDSLCPLAE